MPIAFLLTILLETALLMLSIARTGQGVAPLPTALFTANSAVCVTGLVVVETPTYWFGFGQAVILGFIQVGGFEIMTGATLLGHRVARRLRLSIRLLARAETRSMALGNVVGALRVILLITVAAELALAVVLALRPRRALGGGGLERTWLALSWAASASPCCTTSGGTAAGQVAAAHKDDAARQRPAPGLWNARRPGL